MLLQYWRSLSLSCSALTQSVSLMFSTDAVCLSHVQFRGRQCASLMFSSEAVCLSSQIMSLQHAAEFPLLWVGTSALHTQEQEDLNRSQNVDITSSEEEEGPISCLRIKSGLTGNYDGFWIMNYELFLIMNYDGFCSLSGWKEGPAPRDDVVHHIKVKQMRQSWRPSLEASH